MGRCDGSLARSSPQRTRRTRRARRVAKSEEMRAQTRFGERRLREGAHLDVRCQVTRGWACLLTSDILVGEGRYGGIFCPSLVSIPGWALL